MNFLNLIGLIIANRAEEAYDWSKNHLRQTYHLLIFTFCLPFFLLATGIGLGLTGHEGAARLMVGLSGFLCAALLLLVWLRATAFAYIVVLATSAGHHVMDKVPKLTQESADAFLKWLRGAMVWITAVCLYGQIVPIWRNIGVSLIAATCILVLAGVISARWFSGRLAQYALVAGTVLTAGIAVCVATPIGLVSALYLSEYATDRVRHLVKPVLEVLAGVPTVVYGYFALLFVTPLLQTVIPSLSGFNALSPGIVIGMMIIPMVSSLSEDAMYAVPQSLREGAYALGSSKLQVAVKVVVPAAFSGIAASLLLGVSRAIGETMILAIAAGQQPRLTLNPTVPIETMTAYIVQVSLGDTPTGTIEYRTIFAVGMMLFLGTLALNLVSQWIKQRFREQVG